LEDAQKLDTGLMNRVTRGRCYDHNFLRFFSIFGEKLAFFSKINVMIKILHNLALFWVKNVNFFAKFFGENILKIITSVPDWANFRVLGGYFLGKFFLKITEVSQISGQIFPLVNF
jgi:hypothetical protein